MPAFLIFFQHLRQNSDKITEKSTKKQNCFSIFV